MADSGRLNRRTEDIRKRRTSRSRKVRERLGGRKRKHKYTAQAPPPVMARSKSAGERSRDGKDARKTRRRYDVALSTPGSEVRLPSLPRVRIGWRLISFALAALLSFALYQFLNSPSYRVDLVEVFGLQRLSPADVNAVMGVIGKPIFELNAVDMQQDLYAAFPEFSDVSVEIALPQTVVVTVTERVPVLIWRQEGTPLLVDAGGIAFPSRGEALEGIYPEIQGLSDPPVLPAQETAALDLVTMNAMEMLGYPNADQPPTPTASRPLLSPEMVAAILVMDKNAPQNAPLMYDSVHGLGWEDQRGWMVYLGDVQDIEMKLRVYDAIIEHLKAADTRPTLVNVENVHTPYYRLEP